MADQLSEELVAAFNAVFGFHAGARAAHAKGICCAATFIAASDAATLTRAPHMQGSPTRATVRFSNGSGDPGARDAGREPRGMAVRFHLDERTSTDIVSINQPVFIVRTPEDVLEFMRLRIPDPETGKLDLPALAAFVGARPESQRGAEIFLMSPPLASFFEADYHAIHAFRFVAAEGSSRFGRYRWRSSAGITSLTKEEARARTADYLREDLIARLSEAPATFTLTVSLANPGDDPNDPTEDWSEDHEQVTLGTLEITAPLEDQEACERFVFDPTRLCDGIEASDDPVLQARPRAYAISSKRRLAERG